jgi:DNA polymerase-3 subunit alpha
VPFDYLKFSEEIIALAELDVDNARKKYKEVFRYVDMVNGVVVSVGNHPAGCVVSPYPVDEWFGTFTTTTDEYPISVLNMKEIDSLNFVKLDILG